MSQVQHYVPDRTEYNPNRLAAQMRQARERGDPPEVVEDLRQRLFTGRASRALARALAEAPPLTPTQVAYLRAILSTYGPGDDGE